MILPFGSRSLGCSISEFVAHCDLERPHKGMGNELRNDSADTGNGEVTASDSALSSVTQAPSILPIHDNESGQRRRGSSRRRLWTT